MITCHCFIQVLEIWKFDLNLFNESKILLLLFTEQSDQLLINISQISNKKLTAAAIADSCR